MHIRKIFCSVRIGTAMLIVATGAYAEFRNWTNSENRQVEAEFAGMENDNVKLKLRNGTVASVPLATLSLKDQTWVKEQNQKVPPAPAKLSPDTTDTLTAKSKLWPRTTGLDEAPKTTVVTEDAATHDFVYRTAHFEFRCDVKLGADVVREFARVFEGTLQVNTALPLELKPSPEEGEQFFVARLFEDKDDYFNAGAPAGTAGAYSPEQKCIMCPLIYLGVKPFGKRYVLDRDANNSTLIHELTHQMMNHWIDKLPVWYVEGSAEYVTAQKYQRGKFSMASPDGNIQSYLAGRGVRDRGFAMLRLHDLMQVDTESWSKALATDRNAALRNYVSVTILTYYFYHVDGKGDAANIIAWLRALEAGGHHDALTEEHLLRGRSHAEIEKELVKAMRKMGIDLDFTSGSVPP